MRTFALPAVVTGALAWVLGRGGGPLFAFTDTHGRVAGLTAVGVAGVALLAVFYALLLVSLPSVQRHRLVARVRVSADRVTARLH